MDAAVWEHSRVRHLYRNTLMTDFAQAFQNDHNNISDAVNKISPLLIKLFRLIAQSHITFLRHLEELIHKMRFHLPLFTLTLFRTSQKSPQASVKVFCKLKIFSSAYVTLTFRHTTFQILHHVKVVLKS